MNILITSVGRRSYLIKYFQEALGTEGKVHVSNSSGMTPAFRYADKSIVTPVIYDDKYIPFLLEYCIKHQIKVILSVFDIDLPVLSANKELFNQKGIEVIVSSESVLQICNDKWKTYQFLIEKGINTPKTYLSLEEVNMALQQKEVQFPLMIKPRWGMGSLAIAKVNDEEELKVLYNKIKREIMITYLKYESKEDMDKSVLIQEVLSGQEYGLDVINDLKGKYCHTVVKKKHAMRSGETDCAETVEDKMLKNLGETLGKSLGHIGNLDVDVFMEKDTPYLLELNARFGGGYPFSHLAGVNLPLAIIKWLKGDEKEAGALLKEKIGVVGHKDITLVKL